MAQGWQEVNAEFMRRISAREWLPDQLIPAESELAAELGCSRVTVNRALRDLAQRGFLERKRKAGTRVIKNPERKATFVIPITRLEIENRGAVYSHQLLKREIKIPPPEVLARFRLPADSPLLYLNTLHLADAKPFVLEERWVNLAAVPELEAVDLQQQNANEWLVNHVPFSGGDLSLGARAADNKSAQLLHCGAGDALFEVQRTTWQGEQIITFVQLLHAPDYRLLTVL